MNELILQTKYPPICFSSQIAKLNVRQMYHSYGINVLIIHEISWLCNSIYILIHTAIFIGLVCFRFQQHRPKDRMEDASWLGEYLISVEKFVFDDLSVIQKHAMPCFPPAYQINQFYITRYHENLCKLVSLSFHLLCNQPRPSSFAGYRPY